MKTVEDEVKTKVKKFQIMETKLLMLEQNLSKNKEFQQFLKLQKSVNDKANEVWADVEKLMIDNKKKSIDAEWVLLTIVDAKKLEISDKLPKDFTKSVPDTTKINDHIKKTGKTPKGVRQVKTPYLRKTFRQVVS